MRKALAVAALVLTPAASARAEPALLGRADGRWFFGLNAQHVRDGRQGRIDFHFHEGATGWGFGLEAGHTLRREVSISLIYRVTNLSEQDIFTDPGSADLTERQITIGPRLDVWPLAGRLRMGIAVLRTWRSTTKVFSSGGDSDPVHTALTQYELLVGVVPVRWHGLELELTGGFAKERFEKDPGETRIASTFSYGIGLRWRTGAPR